MMRLQAEGVKEKYEYQVPSTGKRLRPASSSIRVDPRGEEFSEESQPND
jgi:TFIIF-interacting CTD phosphatase-like protein